MNGWEDLAEWGEKAIEELLVETKTQAGEVFMNNVTSQQNYQRTGEGLTPVDSGRLMANTIVSVGAPDTRPRDDFDETGDSTYNEGMRVIKSAGAWETIYIQNQAEEDGEYYAPIADYIGWRASGKGKAAPYYFFTRSYMRMLSAMED